MRGKKLSTKVCEGNFEDNCPPKRSSLLVSFFFFLFLPSSLFLFPPFLSSPFFMQDNNPNPTKSNQIKTKLIKPYKCLSQ